MRDKLETQNWKEIFGSVLKLIFSLYNLRDVEFADRYKCDTSATKNWKTARSFPSKDLFKCLKEYILEKSKECKVDDAYLLKEMETIFRKYGYGSLYIKVKLETSDSVQVAVRILQYCVDAGKGNIEKAIKIGNDYPSEGRTQVVVFDFDGTLTQSGRIAKTTWEILWISLGYDIKECQDLHKKFDRKEITHEEWCYLTERKFKAKNLHREVVKNLSKKIHLIKGVKEVFQQLNERDVKIYIVSGSIMLVIQRVLGSLTQYVDSIKANQLMFNEAGYLNQIIGTKYDFEGKADYILQIADELKISTKDILFIGNSRNDHFVYMSGARTLCINPILTDMTNTEIWHDCIEMCDDLTEILEYI